MPRQAYVFKADLDGVPGVHRTMAVRSDQTLVALHYALQDASGWDDDHFYSFWLKGEYWGRDGSEYSHPIHTATESELSFLRTGPAPKSADARLDRLKLSKGQRIAYVFDFGDEWRVRLTVRNITAADDGTYPRLLDSIGDAPPQYPDYEDEEEAA